MSRFARGPRRTCFLAEKAEPATFFQSSRTSGEYRYNNLPALRPVSEGTPETPSLALLTMMGGMIMVRNRFMVPIWLGLCVLALGSCAPQPTAATSQAQAPAVGPGMARVWFFRQADPTGGNVFAGTPIVYANGAPVGDVPQGTVFFHDFPPGKYRFTVQPFGTPTREHDTLQLVPGTQAYVQVQWEANWEANRTGGGSSFTVLTSSPEIAQQYLPTLTNLGQR